MSNEIGFSLSVGEFKNQQEEAEEMVKHLMRFTGMGITIEIDEGPWRKTGYIIKAHGWAPWMSNLKWFIDLVQEKELSADLSTRDGIGNSREEVQFREGDCVYQRDGYIYYYKDNNYEKEILYDDDDEESITYKHGEKGPSLEDYLREKDKVLWEKERVEEAKMMEEFLKDQEDIDTDTDNTLPF